MPTIFIVFGFTPVALLENNGFKVQELKLIESIIEENKELIAEHWNNYFNKADK